MDNWLQNGALVLSNPGTSGVPDTVHQHAAALQGHRDREAVTATADLQVGECENRSEDPTGTSKDNTCMGLLGETTLATLVVMCKPAFCR